MEGTGEIEEARFHCDTLLAGYSISQLVPIIGLALAATFFFVLGGFSLIKLLVELLLGALGVAHSV
jgi:hypothetical protein